MTKKSQALKWPLLDGVNTTKKTISENVCSRPARISNQKNGSPRGTMQLGHSVAAPLGPIIVLCAILYNDSELGFIRWVLTATWWWQKKTFLNHGDSSRGVNQLAMAPSGWETYTDVLPERHDPYPPIILRHYHTLYGNSYASSSMVSLASKAPSGFGQWCIVSSLFLLAM